MNRFRLWMRLTRGAYLPVILAPVAVGVAYAVHDAYEFRWIPFLLASAGSALAFLGTNVATAFLDLLAGTDPAERERDPGSLTGPDVVGSGLLGAAEALGVGAVALALALLCGLALVPLSGSAPLGVGLLGFLLALAYSLPRYGMRLLGHGLGELAALVVLGPLTIIGAYSAQSGRGSMGAVLAGLPVGLYAAAILYDRQLTRLESDERKGRMSLGVVLGEDLARRGCVALPLLAYGFVLINVALGEYPRWCLAALLTAPLLLWKAARLDATNPPKVYEELTRAVTVLHVATALLIAGGFLVSFVGL